MTEEIDMSKAVEELKNASEKELREVIEKWFESIRNQGMKIGANYIAIAVYDTIQKSLKNGMSSSHRDFERAIKKVLEIVSVQLKRKETQQNDLAEAEINDGTAE